MVIVKADGANTGSIVTITVPTYHNSITLNYSISNGDNVVAGANGLSYDIKIKHKSSKFTSPLLDSDGMEMSNMILSPLDNPIDGALTINSNTSNIDQILGEVTYIFEFNDDNTVGDTSVDIWVSTSKIETTSNVVPDLAFTTVWKTTTPDESITIPFNDVNSFDVDWGDGNVENITTTNPTHQYSIAGEYTVKCLGSATGYGSNNSTNQAKCIDILNWGDMGIQDFWHAFRYANLTNVTASDALSGAVYMQYMFANCAQLSTIDVSSFDTSNCLNFGNMFADSSSLTTLDTTNWDTSACNNMNAMFNFCSNLSNIYGISGFDTTLVTDMAYMFAYCPLLSPIDVSSWNIENVTVMYDFYGGTSVWTTTEYDKALVSFSAQSLQPNVSLRVSSVKYTETAAHDILTSAPNNWIITDGGIV